MVQKENSLKSNILQDFVNEREELQKQIQNNLDEIQRIDCYLEVLKGEEENDYKVFSPRNVERKNRDTIQEMEEKKKTYLSENSTLDEKVNKINYYIDRTKKCAATEKTMAVLCIQETERQRIAKELHDTSLQNLAHLVHLMELSSMYIDQDPIKAKLELAVVSKSLKTVIEEIRSIIFDLRPMSFDDLGFAETLERLLDKLNKDNEFEIIRDIQQISCNNNMVLLSIYRVIQESMNNAIKHSGGDKIWFSCKEINRNCHIEIRDNGKGFTIQEAEDKKENKHFGLSIIKERIEIIGGTIEVNTELGVGTKITFIVPLDEE